MYVSRDAVVASESFFASRVGVDVLSRGGNAVDAAVAVSLALSGVLPYLGGLGGDLIAVVRGDKVRTVMGIGWSSSLLRGVPPLRGPESATVPGLVRGLQLLHARYGSMEWGRLVGLAVSWLERGPPAHPSLVRALRRYRELLAADRGSRESYLFADVDVGDPFVPRGLLNALRVIADHGADGFYDIIARDIVEYTGTFTLDDFTQYRAVETDTVVYEYRGFKVHEAPPPSMGLTTLLMLRLLEGHEYGANSGDRVCRYVAAARRAYGIRNAYLGDVEVDVGKLLAHPPTVPDAERPGIREGDTTYFAVATRDMSVSAIQSLYYPFGSAVTVPGWGITLNNRASDFAEAGPNAAAPRKRPLHTLSALLVEGDGAEYLLGASAGHYRPFLYAWLVDNVARFGHDVRRAVAYPRALWEGGSEVSVEIGIDVCPGLVAEVVDYPGAMGVAAGVYRGGALVGFADPRGDGAAWGI